MCYLCVCSGCIHGVPVKVCIYVDEALLAFSTQKRSSVVKGLNWMSCSFYDVFCYCS